MRWKLLLDKMLIHVRVHPNSSQEKIEVLDKGGLEVWLKKRAVEGKANLDLLKLLKKYFKKEIKIKTGFNSRNKTLEICAK